MGKKAAIYARVSTFEKQDYARQIEELKIIILNSKYKEEDIEVFSENISGKIKNNDRPELKRLLEKIEADPQYFSCIYTSEVSRIGRNPTETIRIIDDITDFGIPIFIKSINQFTLDTDGKRNMIMSIILQVLIEYASLEIEQFKARSKSGLLHSAKKGRAGGSDNYPYGYKKDEFKMLVINDEEALIIKEIFELYKAGNGTKVISNILNDRKVLTRKNKTHKDRLINNKHNLPKNGNSVVWSEKQVHDILKNTIYKGERRFTGEIINAPAIISKELFDECTDIRVNKTTRNYLTTYNYLLQDVIKCGVCGRNYYGVYKPEIGGQKTYMCSSWLKKGHKCSNSGINISLIESVIYDILLKSDVVLNYINNSKNIKKELKESINKLVQKEKDETTLLKEKNDSKTRLLDLYLSNKNFKASELDERSNKIDNDIASITERLRLVKRDLKNNRNTLNRIDSIKTNKAVLGKAKDDRNELGTIYKEIINKVIVNKIENNNYFISLFIQVNGIVLPSVLKLVLDGRSIKKREKEYNYAEVDFLNELEPVYKDNKLLVDIKEIEAAIQHNLEWQQIPENQLILM